MQTQPLTTNADPGAVELRCPSSQQSATDKLGGMTAQQTVVDRELFVQALRHMSEADLLYLNRMVVERLNLLAQARSTVQLAQFAEGDRVEFVANDGSVKRGTVLRLNKKTASVLTDDAQNWKVSPGLLRKQTATTACTVPSR